MKIVNEKNGIIEYYVNEAPSWDDFESIAVFLEKQYHAIILTKEDVIFIRKWKMQINNFIFTLKHHDDFGNCFFSEQNPNHKILKIIADDLTKRLT